LHYICIMRLGLAGHFDSFGVAQRDRARTLYVLRGAKGLDERLFPTE
jgi:hypothetical protein